jgi:hypothetical protein
MKANSIKILALAALLCACNRAPKFTVSGTIADAASQTLYLEQVTDSSVVTIDSVTLSNDGKYRFSEPQKPFAEFYRLRLGTQNILFAIDSCEEIVLNSQKTTFATQYTVENSENSLKIKQLRNSGFLLQHAVDSALEHHQWNNVEIVGMIDQHKQMAQKIILADANSTAAYYAVNQMVNGVPLFLPQNKNDRSYWSAVATAYKVFQPENPRTKRLENIVLSALKSEKQSEVEARTTGLIDIELPDRHDEMVKLSSLKGKVVLIDFSSYSIEKASVHTLYLRELYNLYHDYGFEIYQVSIDENKLFWLEQVHNIPWVCVRDREAPNCRYLLTYNVQAIPAWFLVNRNGDIVAGRDLDGKNLQKSIEKLLRE